MSPANFALALIGMVIGWLAVILKDADPLSIPFGIMSLAVMSEALDRLAAYRIRKLRK